MLPFMSRLGDRLLKRERLLQVLARPNDFYRAKNKVSHFRPVRAHASHD